MSSLLFSIKIKPKHREAIESETRQQIIDVEEVSDSSTPRKKAVKKENIDNTYVRI